MEPVGTVLAIALLAAMAFLLGYAIGGDKAESDWQQQLIDRGLAEWRVDTAGGVTWHWKDDKPAETK